MSPERHGVDLTRALVVGVSYRPCFGVHVPDFIRDPGAPRDLAKPMRELALPIGLMRLLVEDDGPMRLVGATDPISFMTMGRRRRSNSATSEKLLLLVGVEPAIVQLKIDVGVIKEDVNAMREVIAPKPEDGRRSH